MATFENLKQLEAYVNKAMMDAMKTEVSEAVRTEQVSKIQTEVYDKYTAPSGKYYRRNGNDGLMDKKNMQSTITQDGNGVSLEVKNIAQGQTSPPVDYTSGTSQPDYLAGIIERGRKNGDGLYAYNREGTQEQFLQPRPFTEKTVESLKQTGEHIEAMKKGLKRQNISVE